MGTEFIIVGDFMVCGEKSSGCLVSLAGYTREGAEEKLFRMINSPTKNDSHLMKGGTNFRIEEVESKDCWWNDRFLRN